MDSNGVYRSREISDGNTTSKNVDSGQFDETNALAALNEFVKTLENAKLFGPEHISENYKSKVHSANANIETLLQFWRLNNARKKSPVVSKVDIKLWENELPLKYMFEEYIEYMEMTTKSQVKVMNLFCKICKMSFPESADYLHDHLKGVGHLICYEKMKKDEEALCDSLWDDQLQKCKYSKFVEHNGPNNSLYCKVCFAGIPKGGGGGGGGGLKSHVEGKNHIKKYEQMVKFLIGDDGTKLNDQKSMTDKASSFMKNENLKTTAETKDLISTVDSNLNNLSSGNINSRSNVDRPSTESVFAGQPTNKKTDFDSIKTFLSQALVNLTMQLLKEDKVVYKNVFSCCMCRYMTSNVIGWNSHNSSSKHMTLVDLNVHYRLLTCSCNLTMICDEQTYNWHLSSPDHQRMKDLMQSLKERAVRSDADAAAEEANSAGAVRKASSVSSPAHGRDDADSQSSADSSDDDSEDNMSDSSLDNVPGLLPDTNEAKIARRRERNARYKLKLKKKKEKKERKEKSISNVELKETGSTPKKTKSKKPAKQPESPAKTKEGHEAAPDIKGFDMDSFKRVCSHKNESIIIPNFWKKFDKEKLSIWFGEYKYNKDLTKVFMSCKLITGMFERLYKMREIAFASVCLFGTDNDSTISGVWVWEGHDLAFERNPDWQTVYETYAWEKLDPSSEATKKLVNDYFSWAGADKSGRKFNQGKIFK